MTTSSKTNKSRKDKKITLGQKVKLYGSEYVVVGLSMMDRVNCDGEPEWRITEDIQEVAVAEPFKDISYQKPSWVSVKELNL